MSPCYDMSMLRQPEQDAISLLKGSIGSGPIAVYQWRDGSRIYVDKNGEGETRTSYRLGGKIFSSLVDKGILVNSGTINRFGTTYTVFKLSENA